MAFGLLLPVILLGVAASAKTGAEALSRYEAGDFKAAFQMALPAAEKGQASSQYVMGLLYQDGNGLPQDFAKALNWYRRAVDQNHAPSKSRLAMMYRMGQGVPKNHERAYYWFSESAEQGYSRAMANLGFMHQQGLGVPQDDALAVEWYRKAAELGLDDAQSNLAYMYSQGRGVAVDLGEAARLQRLAAEQGQPVAQMNLGLYYRNGIGVEADAEEAVAWLQRAATQGLREAQRELGMMLAENSASPKDIGAAREWLRKAADQGDPAALSALSRLQLDGGGALSGETLRGLYRAAEEGSVEAYETLGAILLAGRGGVAKDSAAAVGWFRRAAEKGSIMARYQLGRCYETGVGAAKDEIEAHAQYRLAAEAGHDGSRFLANRLEKRMSPDQINAARRRADLYRRPERAGEAAPLKPHQSRRFFSIVDRAPPARKPDPRRFALVVGIGGYKQSKESGGLPRADFADRDAQAVRDHLPALGIPPENTVFLEGRDATHSGIQMQLQDWLPKNITPDATLFVYFAGHGATDPAGGGAYLVPWDGDVRFLRSTALRREDLLSSLKKLTARKVIVVLDTCFSGGGRSVAFDGARPLAVTTEDPAEIPQNIVLLVSASGEQISGTIENEGHGLFTYYFLRGLGGAAKDSRGAVTIEGLHRYLRPLVEKDARLQNREQTPLLLGAAPASFPPLIP